MAHYTAGYSAGAITSLYMAYYAFSPIAPPFQFPTNISMAVNSSIRGVFVAAGSYFSCHTQIAKEWKLKLAVSTGGLYKGEERYMTKASPPLLMWHGSKDKVVSFSLAEAILRQCEKVCQ